MKKIVGVRFRHTGKSYYYDPGDLELSIGTGVIAQAGDGKEYGKVSIPPMELEDEKLPPIIKQIARIATEEDLAIVEENHKMEEEAFWICKEKIAELSLPMKLIHAEYTFERNKLLFYFTADGRVDFRELVRLLASVFRTRIELRQVGVRDETKLMGGIGICGMELSSTTYLSGFAPVSIKMAKEQNLSLNPTKISGVCGRLMCCLAHEEEAYEYLNRTMPKGGDYATNVEGRTGVIRSVNILKQSVLVLFEDGDTREMKEYSVSELGLTPRKQGPPTPEAVEEMRKDLEEKLRKKMEEEIAQALEDGDEAEYNLLERKAQEMKLDESGGKGRRGSRRSRRESGSGEDRRGGSRKRQDSGRGRNGGRGKDSTERSAGKGRDSGEKRSHRPRTADTKNRATEERRNNETAGRGGKPTPSEDGRGDFRKRSKGRKPTPKNDKERSRNRGRGADEERRDTSRKNTGHGRKEGSPGHRNGGYSRGYRTDRKNEGS